MYRSLRNIRFGKHGSGLSNRESTKKLNLKLQIQRDRSLVSQPVTSSTVDHSKLQSGAILVNDSIIQGFPTNQSPP